MKFPKNTNLDSVKKEMKLFAHMILPGDLEFTVHNMFTYSRFQCISNELVDILKFPDAFAKEVLNSIDSAESLWGLYSMVSTPYKLTWLKYVKNYLNVEDFSKYLAESWVNEENPNQDVNVSVKTAVCYFRNAVPNALMDKDELRAFTDAPEQLELYRGVSKGRREYGLSWTDDKNTAEWFSNRFGSGKLLYTVAKKEDLLAYFSVEKEWVLDVYKYKEAIVEL